MPPILRDSRRAVTKTQRHEEPTHARECDVTDDQTPAVNVNVNQQAEPSVRVSLATIYEQVLGLRTDFSRVEAKVELVLRTDDDHEARLREIERAQDTYVTKASARWMVGTLIAVIAAAAGLLALLIK